MSLPRLNWTVVGLLAVLASCSSSSPDKCKNVKCPLAPDGGESADVCDPDTGLCLCGVGAVGGIDAGGGVVCQSGTTCDPVSQTCVSVLCAGIICGDTGACDPIDGTCKCGGAACLKNQTCDELSSTCVEPEGICASKAPCPSANGITLVCDPNRGGACECFMGGPACGPTQICNADGGCIDDPCFGVSCTATGAACYGGICRCGGAAGVECSLPSESCSPIDNSCGPTASCALAACTVPNTICSPLDTLCHCGSTDGPTCLKGEVCTLYVFDGGPLAPFEDAGGAAVVGVCKDSDPCKNILCPPFETCDENNKGACECGGAPTQNIPGAVCTAGESCVDPFDGGTPSCMPDCQPFSPTGCPPGMNPDSGALIPMGCYFFQASKAAVCAPSTAADAGLGANCNIATDCKIGLTCATYPADAGTVLVPPSCVPYCDVFPQGGPTSTPPPSADAGTLTPCTPGTFCSPLPTGIVAGICEFP